MAKNKSEETKEVATVEEKPQLPAGLNMAELLADAGSGNDNMTSADVALPYLAILQSNSPQVNEAHAKYVDGAKASMFYNTVSGEVFEAKQTGVIVVPCYYERRYVEWVDRDGGGAGGYVRDYDADSDILEFCTPNAKGRPALENGNIIVETGYHYCLMLNPTTDTWEQVCIAMSSTQLKKNRKWNNLIVTQKIPGTNKQAPRWFHMYQLTTAPESKGENSWWGFNVELLEEPVTAEIYAAGKAFYELASAGAVKRTIEPGDEVAGENISRAGGNSKVDDDNIPF